MMRLYTRLHTIILFLLLLTFTEADIQISNVFSKPISKLTVINNVLLVGGTDFIYKVNTDSLAVVINQALTRNIVCPNRAPCPNSETPGQVLYLGEFDNDLFVLCNSYYGHCELRRYADLTSSKTSDAYIVSNRSDASVVGVAAPFNSVTKGLWIASSWFTGPNVQAFALAVRNQSFEIMVNVPPAGAFSDGYNSATEYIDKIPTDTGLRYIYSFYFNNMRFFLRNSDIGAYLASVCSNDTKFTSVVQIPLACQSTGEMKYIAAAFFAGAGEFLAQGLGFDQSTMVLYAAFSPNATTGRSGVCAFNISSIIQEIQSTFLGCHLHASQEVSVGPSEMNSGRCESTNLLFNSSVCQIATDPTWSYSNRRKSPIYNKEVKLRSTSLLDVDYQINALRISVVEKNTIMYMTRPSGIVYKAILLKHGSRIYEEVQLASRLLVGESLQSSLAVVGNSIYALSSSRVFKIPVQECSTANSCDLCSALRDPFCGWCTLEQKCKVFSECQDYRTEGYWLHYEKNTCINVDKDTANEYSVEGTDADMLELKIYLNFLPFDGNYECCLSLNMSMCEYATKGTETSSQHPERPYLTCKTPSKKFLRDSIPVGKDLITTSLKLRSSGKDFSQTNMTFYDCTRHNSCVSCTNTSLKSSLCSWCTSSLTCAKWSPPYRKCSGDNITDQLDISSRMSGPSHCPKITPLVGSRPTITVPSGTNRTLTMNFENYKNDYMNKLHCELSFDNIQKSYTANLQDGKLHCLVNEPFFYPDDVAVKSVTFGVSVDVEGVRRYIDNPMNMNLELFKCNLMGENCGKCLVSSDKYSCGWCQAQKSTCQVEELCSNGSPFLQRQKSDVCPDVEILEVDPINGPINGGTQLTIKGDNLGQSYSEIANGVYIYLLDGRKVPCIPNNRENHGPTQIKCLLERTEIQGEGRAHVTINGSTVRNANSTQTFNFYKPVFRELSSTVGPRSGGSKIRIQGEYLKIGSRQLVIMTYANGTSSDCAILPNADERNLSYITILTPAVSTLQTVQFTLSIDNFIQKLDTNFTYKEDATIIKVVPQKGIQIGGTYVLVTGTALDIVSNPQMYLEKTTNSDSRRKRRNLADNERIFSSCTDVTESTMKCILPSLPVTWWKVNSSSVAFSFGFLMDGIESTKNLQNNPSFGTFEIVQNPSFVSFGNKEFTTQSINESPMTIRGDRLLSIGSSEVVIPMIKVEFKDNDGNILLCNVTTVQDKLLYCVYPRLQETLVYEVKASYGDSVEQVVGTIKMVPDGLTMHHIIYISVGVVVFVIIVIIIVVAVLKHYKNRHESTTKKYQAKIDNLEMTVARECKEAFAELQTDMTEMRDDILSSHGLPFHEYDQYCMKLLFPPFNDDDHPSLNRMKVPEPMEKGLAQFQKIIYNKTFLLAFIRTLEQQKKFVMKDRVEVASYLSVALQPKMEYQTDILKTLLQDLIEKTMDSNQSPKLLLRRTESVAEKMLCNWFAFLMHKFMKECAGEPLYVLYTAIKQHVYKGPVDAISGDAKYSLSEDKLLRQSVDSKALTLRFVSPDQHAVQDPQLVKVLDCDTISQAIDKILDTIHRNAPYSTHVHMSKERVCLEWIKPNGDVISMYDDDPKYCKISTDNCKQIATLSSYKICDNANVRLTERHFVQESKSSLHRHTNHDSSNNSNGHFHGTSAGDSLSRTNSSSNILDTSPGSRGCFRYHLVKPNDAVDTQQEGDRNKMVSEIYLTRLLGTKGVLQPFVDDLFETIFSTTHRGSALPLAIKYMFDFLDDQALSHNIAQYDVVHHWKSNSLPLRFWVSIIKNPDFVFDIHKSQTVDACLNVVAQIFMESCSLTEHKLSKDSPSSKLLYAKDIPKYRKWVERYYSDVKSMPAINDQEMNALLMEESKQHKKDFNTNAALFQLSKYLINFQAEVMQALKDDEFAKKDQLAQQMEHIIRLLNFGSARL